MKAKFPSFTLEGQIHQYSFNTTHMFATVNGKEYSAPITQEQRDKLLQLKPDDQRAPADIFAQLTDHLIERETGLIEVAIALPRTKD